MSPLRINGAICGTLPCGDPCIYHLHSLPCRYRFSKCPSKTQSSLFPVRKQQKCESLVLWGRQGALLSASNQCSTRGNCRRCCKQQNLTRGTLLENSRSSLALVASSGPALSASTRGRPLRSSLSSSPRIVWIWQPQEAWLAPP